MERKQDTSRISFAMRVRVPESVQRQELEGESIILNLETDLYLGLNKSGTQILNELSRFDSIEEAYQALLEKFEIEPEKLRAELSEFLETLLEQQLIELHEP